MISCKGAQKLFRWSLHATCALIHTGVPRNATPKALNSHSPGLPASGGLPWVGSPKRSNPGKGSTDARFSPRVIRVHLRSFAAHFDCSTNRIFLPAASRLGHT